MAERTRTRGNQVVADDNNGTVTDVLPTGKEYIVAPEIDDSYIPEEEETLYPEDNAGFEDGMFNPDEDGVAEAVEPIAVDEGVYNIRISQVEVKKDENDHTYFIIRFEIEDVAESKEVVDFLRRPNSSMSGKRRNDAAFKLQCFMTCFNIDMRTPTHPKNDWPDMTGRAHLVKTESKQYGWQNQIKTYMR